MTFEIGQKFYSFKELKDEVEKYSNLYNTHFYIRDATTLRSQQNLKRCAIANKDLIYYNVKYACVYGGRKHVKRSLGGRKAHSIRYGCGAFISVTLSKDATALKVTRLNLEHNHPNFSEVPKLHVKDNPSNKRRLRRLLNAANSSQAEKPARKKIRSSPAGEITSSDPVAVSNLVADEVSNSTPEEESNSTLKAVSNSNPEVVQPISSEAKVELSFKKICEKNSCDVNILLSNNELKAAFLQDDEMKMTYHTFPEVFFFNRTCTISDVDLVCFTFLTIGIAGLAEVIAIGFVENEDKDSLNWLLNTFKDNNENYYKTRIVLTDKDLVELDLFKDKFPQAAVSICRYSTLQIFRQEVTPLKILTSRRSISAAEKLMRRLCDSTNERTYMDVYNLFLALPSKLKEYYDKNWHPIRKEWTCISFYENHFITSLNDQLECFNTKLNYYIGDLSNLEEFIGNYFFLINTLRTKKVRSLNPDVMNQYFLELRYKYEGEPEYYNLLVSYAFKSVSYQLRHLHTDELVEVAPSQYYFSQDEVLFRVNPFSCDCIFTKAMRLPCKHIFTVRKKMQMSVFDPDLVDPRWFRPLESMLENAIASCRESAESDEPGAIQDENESENVDLEQETFAVRNTACGREGDKIISDDPNAVQHESNSANEIDLERERFVMRNTAYYPESYVLMSNEPEANLDENNSENEQSNNLELVSFTARKTAALELSNKLAQSIAESTDEVYEEKMKLMENILNHWKSGGRVTPLTLLPSETKNRRDKESVVVMDSTKGLSYKTNLPKTPYRIAIPSSCTIALPQSLKHGNSFEPAYMPRGATSSQSLGHQDQAKTILMPCETTSSQSLVHQDRSKTILMPSDATSSQNSRHQEKTITIFIPCDATSSQSLGHEDQTKTIFVPCDATSSQSLGCQDQTKTIFIPCDTSSQSLGHEDQTKTVLMPSDATSSQSLEHQDQTAILWNWDATASHSLGLQDLIENSNLLKNRKKPVFLAPFEELPLRTQREIILSWFVDKNLASRAANDGEKIEENHVVVTPDKIPVSCADEKVDLSVVQCYFTEDAWKRVTSILDLKKKKDVRKCITCGKSASEDTSVKCCCCLLCYHHTCAGYKSLKVSFCQRCMIDCPEDENGDPLPFEKFPLLVKQERILSWFVDEDLASRIIKNGGTVEDTDVVSEPSEVPLSCIHSSVDLSIVKDFFSESAWELVNVLVEQVMLSKYERSGCAFCGNTISRLYKCRSCLLYYNLQCIAYQKYPRESKWFCTACKTDYL